MMAVTQLMRMLKQKNLFKTVLPLVFLGFALISFDFTCSPRNSKVLQIVSFTQSRNQNAMIFKRCPKLIKNFNYREIFMQFIFLGTPLYFLNENFNSYFYILYTLLYTSLIFISTNIILIFL